MFASVEEALRDYAAGRMIIIVDDADRENEGDLACAAQHVTAETIAFMAREGRGLICLALAGEIADRLGLEPMVCQNRTRFGTNFTVSIEAARGVTTGISAADRAQTIRVAVDPNSGPHDLVQPGHVFPLRAAPNGVLERRGQTEAAVDLARLAGLQPAGVICEIMNDDGTMARGPDLVRFSVRHDLKIISVDQLVAYRKRHERLIERMAEAQLPTRYGAFHAVSYSARCAPYEAVALVIGHPKPDQPVLARLHSECLTGDVFGSLRCDCGEQIDTALRQIAAAGCGVLIYLRQEGRGIGLHNKLRAYALQEQGFDTVAANEQLGFPADLRDYTVGAQILADLGVRNVHLLTNNPQKVAALREFGFAVTQVPVCGTPNPHNIAYLLTKRNRLGHQLENIYDHL
ncbi:bifunctional 3,4-dihydroxy-2-butanone-4-phosphate synthase/GTP cyclohydrolase II [Chloroflexus sp.]|uniref:bifunctional 3,4-dihydroxy-2-butanone-4-phosphate synthase/GTP cyclohydrolase II n=1 Tax=Chloroflexus sp. TaxID=1904827 RepID=UPI002ADE175D|nr:bifunctional 3,4-dihydroxy-2-butanone-4-phosphate synthase/GTP cyclohydrolase II [Chloroflexus sp.]